jgi:tRNA uridine 5-carboxymethylaminomethyl modification enzyme
MQHATFDVIIVGGGHAGTEAALASARLGASTLLLTQAIETLGQLSCNPSIGGIGKSHLVREIDALGGIMAIAADQSGIQWRVLNGSKGPAVRATRAQVDRQLYKQVIRKTLENQKNLKIFQQAAVDLILKQGQVVGVMTQLAIPFYAKTVVLTAGTFLAGKIHVGNTQYSGGRAGEAAATSLANCLRQLPLRINRLKTGTPPRLDGRTIDFNVLVEQPSDYPLPSLSYLEDSVTHPPQRSCFITHTSEATHALIRENLQQSPLYSGQITGIGPRYCPSIEDKVVRFANKPSHQIFLEPEGLETHEIYPNGLSTSLPFSVQVAMIHSLAGLENAHLLRPGYAIEYDFFDPRDLYPSLESRIIPHLFCAGQINGTTGYEEAAAQGLIAGLNAALKAQGNPAWWPRRDQAYIGVLIDDLITQGTLEPYRMFTSRAECRLSLREDNADLRLTEIGYQLGLVEAERWRQFQQKKQLLEQEQQRLNHLWIRPGTPLAETVSTLLSHPLSRETTLASLLTRPEVSYMHLMAIPELGPGVNQRAVQMQLEIQARYEGYISRQNSEIEKQRRHETTVLPETLDYQIIHGLSTEIREKLQAVKPLTVGQAARIPGVTPAALSLLLIHLKKQQGIKGMY